MMNLMMRLSLITLCFFVLATGALAQEKEQGLDRVLQNLPDKRGHGAIAADRGSAGLWERLLKLETTGSVMHTTAHPDDEHAGILTMLGRGQGHRTALLTINRGEGGANAVGSELFDALGMIRTEELRQSARYYGLDDQYFTSFTDYGYSKTLDEALTNWGRENVLRDMVRVIRLNRPTIVISRFHGSRRDGHGHHQAAGGITPEAVEAAADPKRFMEDMFFDGARPWKVQKLYRGGVREQETWHVKADPGTFNARLGTSYQNFGYYGLSLQYSQTSGRYRESVGSTPYFYERIDNGAANAGAESDFFDGIDTSISGLFVQFDESHDAPVEERLALVQESIDRAKDLYDVSNPEAVLPALVEGLRLTREILALIDQSLESAFVLRIKEEQFEDAIHTALGIQLLALGVPADTPEVSSPWAPLPTMGVVVPGQSYKVQTHVLNPGGEEVNITALALESMAGLGTVTATIENPVLADNQALSHEFLVAVPDDVSYSSTYFSRESIFASRYSIANRDEEHRSRSRPAQEAVLTYELDGVVLELREVVRTRRAILPRGYERNELKIAPRVAVNASPSTRFVPLVQQPSIFDVAIEVLNNDPAGLSGVLTLQAPDGWEIEPASIAATFQQAGEQQKFSFKVTANGLATEAYPVRAVFEADGEQYQQGYEIVDQQGFEKHYLYRPARVDVHGVGVEIASNMEIGYVMGVGDEVPAAIEQLGASVTLLDATALESGDFNTFDAIVIGTRAYAVRQDLIKFNGRLLDFARGGGHLIVLYQTPEYDPNRYAPYPADLPRSAEEISEEDAPVEFLQSDHPIFQYPNTISLADFDGWVEQRGSKFFTRWDNEYLPMIVSNDTGQKPQEGGWLMADVGSGHFTYFAYAIHRQAPFAVPGALRIFANLLSYTKRPGR